MAVCKGELRAAAIVWGQEYLLATSHHTAGLPPCVGWGHTGCHVPIREGSPQGDLSLAVPSASKTKDAEMAGMSSRGKRKEIRMGTEPRLVPVTRMGWDIDPTGLRQYCAKDGVPRRGEQCRHRDLWAPIGLSLAGC